MQNVCLCCDFLEKAFLTFSEASMVYFLSDNSHSDYINPVWHRWWQRALQTPSSTATSCCYYLVYTLNTRPVTSELWFSVLFWWNECRFSCTPGFIWGGMMAHFGKEANVTSYLFQEGLCWSTLQTWFRRRCQAAWGELYEWLKDARAKTTNIMRAWRPVSWQLPELKDYCRV